MSRKPTMMTLVSPSVQNTRAKRIARTKKLAQVRSKLLKIRVRSKAGAEEIFVDDAGKLSGVSDLALRAAYYKLSSLVVREPFATDAKSSSMPSPDTRYADLPVVEGIDAWAGNPRDMRKEDLEFFGLD